MLSQRFEERRLSYTDGHAKKTHRRCFSARDFVDRIGDGRYSPPATRGGQAVSGLAATLDIYRRAFTRAGGLALRNWLVLASVFLYAAILLIAVPVSRLFGLMLGGFVMGFVTAACAASFLYLVEMIVVTQRVTMADFRRSFGAYLWDVAGVMFVWMLLFHVAGPKIAAMPYGGMIIDATAIAVVVFFNAVPELIYLGHHSTMALFSESYRFITENWLEWFPPNLLLLIGLIVLWRLPLDGWAVVAQSGLLALFVYFAMVVRGLLFSELNGSSRRSRIFRYRMGR
jgi:hypothetical protein